MDAEKSFKVKAAIFLSTVAGASALFGFGATVAAAKKNDPKFFNKGLDPAAFGESGASLALRALGRGTLYSFTGFGLFIFAVWKLSGAKDFEEFRYKAASILPKIPKNNPPVGRTEFSGLNDLLDYLSKRDK